MFDENVARALTRLADDWGIHLPGTKAYTEEAWKRNFQMAMDAQPQLITTSNAGIPAFLTTIVDPELIRVLVAPNKAAEILGEVQKGTWLDETIMFSMIERTGEVSSYDDYSTSGRAGVNTMFPQRQSYLYQVIKEYGEREMERAGLAKIGWASEIDQAAVFILNKYQNYTYFFGVLGLQNYGLLNDPGLSAPITPSVKAGGGNKWMNGNLINATANEIFADIQALIAQIIAQTANTIEMTDEMILAMSPGSQVALTATNSFAVNVEDLLKKNFPRLKIVTAPQYGVVSATNPQGIIAGNMIQLIVPKIEGQDSGYCAFNEKLRNHPLIRHLSSFQQKATQGTWGAIIRRPLAFASMVGV